MYRNGGRDVVDKLHNISELIIALFTLFLYQKYGYVVINLMLKLK